MTSQNENDNFDTLVSILFISLLYNNVQKFFSVCIYILLSVTIISDITFHVNNFIIFYEKNVILGNDFIKL